MMNYLNTIQNIDCLEFAKSLPENSIDCVITSPPYYQLRDYGFSGQWGLEKTYQEYLDNMILLMTELKRILKPTGTMWINLGDSYNGSGNDSGKQNRENSRSISGNRKVGDASPTTANYDKSLQKKSLMLIPHRFAIRCIDELGLILRNDIIWAKRNGMPESVTDRFSKKHEFIFLFVKQQKYYFNLDAVRVKALPLNRWGGNKLVAKGISSWDEGTGQVTYRDRDMQPNDGMKNPGDVSDFWDIPTQPSSEKHYATFNFDLIDKPIIAGCPEGGIIFDPFAGTGTTLIRALQLGREAIGCDGNKDYCEIANRRIQDFQSQIKLAI